MSELVIIDDRARFLAGRGRNDYSQFGEDGLIEAVFERIGVGNRWCFEVGAADGEFFSNTKRLWLRGWDAVLIEGHDYHYRKLELCRSGHVRTVHEWIGPDSLDLILATHGAPRDLDLGVIDIDGHDYYCWQGMTLYRPRVLLIEFSPYREPDYLPAIGEKGQAGLLPICELGAEKGYVALCHTYCNVLFCEREAWERM